VHRNPARLLVSYLVGKWKRREQKRRGGVIRSAKQSRVKSRAEWKRSNEEGEDEEDDGRGGKRVISEPRTVVHIPRGSCLPTIPR
jgi:hypothetical protein